MKEIASQPVAAQPPPALPRDLRARLRGLILRLRTCVLLEGLAIVAAFVLLATHVQFGLDYWLRLEWSMRAALLMVVVVSVLYLLWRRVYQPLALPISLTDAAHLVEREHPQLASRLVSAVQFAGDGPAAPASNSPAMMASVVEEVGAAIGDIRFPDIVQSSRAKWAGLAFVGILAFAVAAAAASPSTMQLWVARNILLQDRPWPQRTHLIVDIAGDTIVAARGDDVEIRARAEGAVIPRNVDLSFELASGKRGRESMIAVGQRGFRYTFKAAREAFTFSLAGGDDRTDRYRVVLVDRPRVESIQLEVTPPAYTGLQTTTLPAGQRSARVLAGSEVVVRVRTNKPVREASLSAGDEVFAAAADARAPRDDAGVADGAADEDGLASASLRFRLQATDTQTYHFALTDQAGMRNKRPARISLRVLRDAAPKLRVKIPGVADLITPQAVLPIEVEFSDDYGLASAELVLSKSQAGEAEQVLTLDGFDAGLKSFDTSLDWSAGEASIVPGERVVFYVRAYDFDTVSGPNYAQSPEVSLRVVTTQELREELIRREQEARAQLERLVDTQEQLRADLLDPVSAYRKRRGDAAKRLQALSHALAPLERKQRNIAGSLNVLRQSLEQILQQYRINQLNTAAVEARLAGRILEPLTALAKRDLVAAADQLRRAARVGDEEELSGIDDMQAGVVLRMREILADMLQWEGYQEVVSMLRDIIRLQAELHEAAQEESIEGASDVFED